MGISNHELHNEFPQFGELIDELRKNDPTFQHHFGSTQSWTRKSKAWNAGMPRSETISCTR